MASQRKLSPSEFKASLLVFFLISSLYVIQSGINLNSTEYFMFRTLLAGNPFNMYSEDWPFYDPIFHEGRIQPLVGMPQNLALLFFEKPPEISIFIVQALLCFLSAFFMLKMFIELGESNWFAVTSIALLFLVPPVVHSLYHPVLTESTLILTLAMTLYFYLKCLYTQRITYYSLLFTFTILACLAKVSAAIILVPVTLILLISDILKNYSSRKRIVAHTIVLLTTAIGTLLPRLFGITPGDLPAAKIGIFLQYTYYTDPLTILLFVPMGVCSPLYGILKGKYDPNFQFCSALMTAAVIYTGGLITFGKHSNYQLAPAYFLSTFLITKFIVSQYYKSNAQEN